MLYNNCMDLIAAYGRILRREGELFLGLLLLLGGIFNWSSGKYCDGNTADYLSCTNPSTYYYYGAAAVAFIIVGACLMLLWYFRRKVK